mgnify:CR=1 FL=1
MALSKLTISIYFLSVVLFVQMGAGDDPLQLLGIDCRKSNYFPAGAGSRYHKNLNILLSRLQSRTPETGFALEYVDFRNSILSTWYFECRLQSLHWRCNCMDFRKMSIKEARSCPVWMLRSDLHAQTYSPQNRRHHLATTFTALKM